ncbi:MAG: signal peptidase I [Bacteroidota bacterium]
MTTEPTSTSRRIRLRDVAKVVGFALLVALVIRLFLFEPVNIPTSSMERNVRAGDFLIVSKLHYGPRLPMTFRLPFTSGPVLGQGGGLPYTRLPGLTQIKRGDPVLFNLPIEDGPIDRRTPYVKRVIGLAADTLAIREKTPLVNGMPQPLGPEMLQEWWVYLADKSVVLPAEALNQLGIERIVSTRNPRRLVLNGATREQAAGVGALPGVLRVEPVTIPEGQPERGVSAYPRGSSFNRDYFGPVVVPARGLTVRLTNENYAVYRPVIIQHEGRSIRRVGPAQFQLDGLPADTYTFEQDYLFVMGDNRDDSRDSREWGFVPMSHVIGRPILIYFSVNPDDGSIRWDRVMQYIERR